jgi:hypothetical protein
MNLTVRIVIYNRSSDLAMKFLLLYLLVGTLRAADQKHLESFEMWCWRRMEKISWTDQVRNEEVLLRVKEQRNILHEISKRKANWIGHCLLRQVIEGKIKGGIEVIGRRGRRSRKLLDDPKERILTSEEGSSRSHYVESSLWKRLWTCRETDY